MRYAEIVEGRDADLFHATGIHGALRILRSGEITTGRRGLISTSRDPFLLYYNNAEKDYHGRAPVQFVIDQRKVSQRYHISPSDFWNGRATQPRPSWMPDEAEERIHTHSSGLSLKFVKAVVLLPADDFHEVSSEEDTHYLNPTDSLVDERYYDEIKSLASQHGIAVVDQRDVDLHENATAGSTSAASVATVVGGLGTGFDPNGHKGIYQDVGKKKKQPLIRR